MCDQTEVSYLPNDVVWVKLSNVWWPAQVQDETKLDEDVTSGLRKKPLAIVKFFDEDLYEFPKNLNQIYHYNCFKKEEFIRKGLDLCRPSGYREVSENMKKFPLDIKKAEILTGGNPDIINDPKYLPEEKFDYREQFGLKPRKKTSLGSKHSSSDTDTPKQSRVKFSTPISAPSTSRTPEMKISNSTKSFSNPIKRTITMKRVASGIVRSEKFDKENDSNKFSLKQYYCSFCNYSCGRMGVIIEHYRSHYRGLILPLPTQIPQNYCKIFQSNFLKRKDGISSTPNAASKYVSEKSSVKRKNMEDSTPLKKRKYDPTKKEKTVATPGSSMAIPVKDIVGSAATPKKRPRKSKDTKSVTAKVPEALDILKDWEDDLEEEVEIKLTDSEGGENDDVKDTSKSTSDSLSENEQPQQPPQDHKSPVSKEKCCFDFEDNDESLSLNKSLKFGQKLPRVIAEEKPNVHRLLKELKESKESSSTKEEPMNEDFSAEIENLLKSTEVPKLPGIPKTNLPQSIEKPLNEDSSEPVKDVTERIDSSNESNEKVSSEEIEIESEDSSSMIPSVTSSQISVESASKITEKADSQNESVADSPSEPIKKEIEAQKLLGDNTSDPSQESISALDVSISENIPDKKTSDLKKSEEKEHLTQEAYSSKDNVSQEDISRNESKTISNESEYQSVIDNEVDEADITLPSTTVGSTVNKEKMKEFTEKISESEKDIKDSFAEEEVSNKVEDSTPMEVDVDSHDKNATSKAEEEQCISKQNDGIQRTENISTSEAKSSNEDDEKSLRERETTDKQSELHQIPIDNMMKIHVVTSSVKDDKPAKVEPSTSSDTPTDQIPFDINSMPIVIDQDPIMEIMEGHVEPLPNADVVRLYIRNSGEEEPEDFQSPRRLLTVSPPPPNLPPIPGIKKVPLPPPKNKNGANSSNKISASTTSGSSTRYTLSKQPAKTTPQQPKILFIKSTSGAPGKLLIPQQQSSIFAQAGKLQPGTRILTTNPQMVSKGSIQKKVTTKSIVVGKQGFPTTAKVVPKSVIGQVIQKVSQQPIICNKNASTVLVNSPKTIVSRQVGRNVLLSSQQLKTGTTAMQVTGAKVVRAAQVVKAPGTVFQQAETILSQKVVQSSSLNENKKQAIKNKPVSPNILQKTQRKVARQQIIKKPQLLTIPSSVQQQSEVVTVNNLPIVQSIGSHSSSEPVKMLYLVDNSQYTVENPVIPVENDSQNIYVTSTSSSGNIDNIIFSIDGTANFVNISNDTATSSSAHVPSQDILAKALANTQVLQSETTDIVDSENTVYVDQQFQAPSLSNTVLETSLTLNQPPIMTPLEVPSSIAPQSSVSHIIPITNIAKKADIQQPSMPLLTDDVDVPGNTVFLSDTSAIPTTSGHLTFQLVQDNNLVASSGIMQDKSLKLNSDSKEDNVLPEFLKGNFGSKSEIPKKEPSPKCSER